ncbi:hypothetical protein G9A89_009450 [Geosiphon pyriformis]|nr:hypothetical protein G9A89_009450 [Geosiphon pyriformis]
MPSPPKPWEKTKGAASLNTQQASLPRSNTMGLTQGATPPAIPARPTTTTSSHPNVNRSYNSYGHSPYTGMSSYGGVNSYNSYGSGYSPYRYGSYSSGYSPYNRYNNYSSYNSYGSYGASPYSRFGGNTYGAPGAPGPGVPDDISLTQRMEASTSAGFHMIESVVNAFGGFASMLESTFFATHSSFMAMVGVVEQFGNLRNYLGQILSVFAVVRWIRKIFYKIMGTTPPANPNELTPINFEHFQENGRKSRRPLLFFILAVFGVPFLTHKLIQVLSRRREAQRTHDKFPPENNGELSLQSPVSVSPQNLEFCRALYDFTSEFPVELSFQRGDIIAILSKTDSWGQPSLWWRGRMRSGEQGVFPSNYVEIINKGGSNLDSKEVNLISSAPNDFAKNSDINVQEFENKFNGI